MKSLMKKYPKEGIWMEDVPMPEIGVNDVLVKIKKTAICGTDVHIYNWDEWSQATIPVPMVVGHEFAGEIVELGKEVKGYKVGDRVSGEGHVVCGQTPPLPQYHGDRRQPSRVFCRISVNSRRQSV